MRRRVMLLSSCILFLWPSAFFWNLVYNCHGQYYWFNIIIIIIIIIIITIIIIIIDVVIIIVVIILVFIGAALAF